MFAALTEIFAVKKTRVLFFLGLGVCLLTALVNIGIIALDDYEFVIAQIIPAQVSDFSQIASGFQIRSPLHPLLLAAVTKLGWKLGIEYPPNQLRFTLFWIGLLVFSLNALFAAAHFDKSEGRKREIVLFLVSFFFLCPLFFTRPMIETMSTPFLTLSACYASRYWRGGSRSLLMGALLGLVGASLFRFQSGVCAIALLATVILSKRYRDLLYLAVLATIAFVLTGFLDQFFTGSFHGALRSYLAYNLGYATAHYGHQPFYVFIVLFFALTLPPTFFSRYREFDWRKQFGPLFPTLLYFGSFVLVHTLVPHKEDRFMVPVLPLFLVCLTPLVNYFLVTQNGLKQWRAVYFLGINFILLPLVVFNSPQNNTVGLVRYLDERTAVERVIGVDTTLTIFPGAFASRKISTGKIALDELSKLEKVTCAEMVAVRADLRPPVEKWLPLFNKVAEFRPGILEQILVWANPTKNYRRDAIELFSPLNCSAPSSDDSLSPSKLQ